MIGSHYQGSFESDEDYRERILRDRDERMIGDSTGEAPRQGIFESDEEYLSRVSREADEQRIDVLTGEKPIQGMFESDQAYRDRIARDARERMFERLTGDAPHRDWLESEREYDDRLVRETDGELESIDRSDTTTRILPNTDALQLEVISINKEVVAYLGRNPNAMFDLHPRKFEELVAELLRDMGADVRLTKATKDGGYDIWAEFRNHFGRFTTLVECKRHRADRPIGVAILRHALGVLHQHQATSGMICTTSYCSPDGAALLQRKEYRFKMAVRDYDDISAWLSKYGTWKNTSAGGIWLPTRCE